MSIANAAIYHDFQGLSELRARAADTPNEVLGEVASQFESLFMQMMLKSMRDATIKGGLFQSDQMEAYQGMYDKQLALALAGSGGLGLAGILADELGGSRSALERRDDVQPLPLQDYARTKSAVPAYPGPVVEDDGAPAGEKVGTRGTTAPVSGANSGPGTPAWLPASPEEYVRGVWNYAVNAAGKLGLDPAVLVAQSALETGWGKKVIQAVDGSSSFNLFGIKADSGWQGDAAAVKSLEFRDGVAALERASFRVYESLSSSFEDYVNFLKSNPRYQQALEKVEDAKQFLHELQNAGYATDPDYADKIIGIVRQIRGDLAPNPLKYF